MTTRPTRRPALPESLAEAGPVWLLTRLAVLLVGFAAVNAIGFPVKAPWTVSDVPLFNLPFRWDTGWYLGIAEHGYTWPPSAASGQSEMAFFPLYPLLTRYAGLVLGGHRLLAAWLVSMGACLWAFVYFYRLARLHLERDASRTALLLLTAYPFAAFYSAAYTESLFLLCIVACVYHASLGQAGRTAAWGLLAGLTRPTGFVLTVVVGLMALTPILVQWMPALRGWLLGSLPAGRQPAGGQREGVVPGVGKLRPWLVLAAAAPTLGLGLYCAHVYALTGDPFQWATVQAAWGKSNAGLGAIGDTLRAIYSLGFERWMNRPIDALNELAVVFVLAATWPVLRRFGLAHALLMLLTIAPGLLSGGVRSLGRYTAPLFPMFLWLGAAVPERHRGLLLFVFAALQALVAILFFTWRPIM